MPLRLRYLIRDNQIFCHIFNGLGAVQRSDVSGRLLFKTPARLITLS